MQSRSNSIRRLSLTVRVSGLLMVATIIPLIVTIIVVVALARPTLIEQAGRNMLADANTHTQLIDNFFAQQILEVQALSRLAPIQQFLSGGITTETLEVTKETAKSALATGRARGSFYENWSLLNLQGELQLSYPRDPQKHGDYYIAPSDLQRFQPDDQSQEGRRAHISDVYYNTVTHEAYIDIYAPVFSTDYRLVGILRATFDLHYIWTIVTEEAGVNGNDSYAFILDQRGVIIAYTNSNPDPFADQTAPLLFKAFSPPPDGQQGQIKQLGIYGLEGTEVPVLPDQADNYKLLSGSDTTFQIKPPEKQEDYQVARSTTYTVPWSYYVLSPMRNITAVADDQLRIILGITTVVLILVTAFGFSMGRRISRPIMHSVESLLNSSQELRKLATKEQSAATQQTWVVDSSQVGLKSVQYYTNAASLATRRLNELSLQLAQHWEDIDTSTAQRAVSQLATDSEYVEKALQHQIASNKKLESAIKVTVHVNDQLATGASAATEASAQLERVVDELRKVVGK